MPSRIDPHQTEVAQAITRLEADPSLATERTMRMLKWVDSEKPQDGDTWEWLKWLTELFGWLAESGRILLWVAAAVVALLVLYIFRLVRAYRLREGAAGITAPSYVRDLDIRPESLPADIGAVAFNLWQRDEHRAALALLYRGLLSRLAHVHGVPIRDSSTEGDCLTLAARYLREDRRAYASQLIRVWQRAVYGGQDPETPVVQGLCSGFAAALDAKPSLELAGQPA